MAMRYSPIGMPKLKSEESSRVENSICLNAPEKKIGEYEIIVASKSVFEKERSLSIIGVCLVRNVLAISNFA